jgi:hypothetical protein
MSAYSDWKCGALSDDEYTFECNREAAMDKYYEEMMYDDCEEEDDV